MVQFLDINTQKPQIAKLQQGNLALWYHQ